RTPSSSMADFSWSLTPLMMSGFKALRASGRLRVSTRTESTRSLRRAGLSIIGKGILTAVTAILQGVRILEVAEHTFVPAASALLSDWGADVIKIEHVERGDAMRGLAASGTAMVPNDVHVLLEHSNRGKRSLGLALTSP